MTNTRIPDGEVESAWSSGETEVRQNWAKAAQLPSMPSELMLIAKDKLIGAALADWGQSICETVVPLRQRIAELEGQVAQANEQWVDDDGNAWLPPTAWAYAMLSKAHKKLKTDNAALRKDAERIQELVNQQAEDEGLWFIAETAPEAYLQQELRKLHAAMERDK